ncbi:MAG TPA: alpha/beta fold hydrolase [Stellaceae bacterium]|nr:alpha/beta fold hydrolase [Stellaceae bacterium]
MATAIKSKALLVLPLLLTAERGATAEDALVDPRGWPIHHELLSHSQDQNKAVELFWAKPEGNGPFPVVLFIHGHQEGPRDGGEAYVWTGRLGIMARQGYVSAAVSQPGYGNSAGPPDYCGPFTQQAVLVAIDFLRRQPFVRANKVALFGYSRGAIVAAMVATQDHGWQPWCLAQAHMISSIGTRHCRVSPEILMPRRARQPTLLWPVPQYIMRSKSRLPFCSSVGRLMSEFRFSRPKALPPS